jgi:hypothetical protein
MSASSTTAAFSAAPRERQILFSAPMIRALLDGTKTQTRRLMNPQPVHAQHHEWNGAVIHDDEQRLWCWKWHTYDNLWDEHVRDDERRHLAVKCPYGRAGEQLWVKETWTHDADSLDDARAQHEDAMSMSSVYYRASMPDDEAETMRWRPSIFMPRWASRITLKIVEVRVQLLQEISEDDARAEGVADRASYALLWDRINGASRSLCWAKNPWIWALTFTRLL